MKIYSLLILLIFHCLQVRSQALNLTKSFGNKGKVVFTNGRYNEVKDVKTYKDSHFFVLAESIRNDSVRETDIVLLKFSSDGKPDLSFGNKGSITFDFPGKDISRPAEMLFYPDGKILIAGDASTFTKSEINTACLLRIFPDGKPDKSFGKEGFVELNFDKVSYLTSLYLNSDNSVFIAGSYLQPFGNHIDVFPVMAKIDANGKPDKSFGKTGKIWIDFFNGIFPLIRANHTAGGEIYDMKVQEDGKILICGGYIFKWSYEGFVARINANGTFDETFNKKGFIRYDFTPGKFNAVKRIELSSDHKLILGAFSQTDFDSDFYFGIIDLNDFSINVSNIDFQGQHDILEDMTYENGEVILSGRSVLAVNVAAKRISDFAAICKFTDINNAVKGEKTIYPFSDVEQNGITSHALMKDKIIAAGFFQGTNVFVKDILISSFDKKKSVKNK